MVLCREISYVSNIIFIFMYFIIFWCFQHSLQNINFWLILNSINFISLVAFIITASLRIGRFDIFFTGFIGCRKSSEQFIYLFSYIRLYNKYIVFVFAVFIVWECYKLFVVYQFYADETTTNAVNDGRYATTTQNRGTQVDDIPTGIIILTFDRIQRESSLKFHRQCVVYG